MKPIIRPAVSEGNQKGFSYTHQGLGIFGRTPHEAYRNWQATMDSLAKFGMKIQ